MGGGNQNALKKAIRALAKQHRGNSLVEQALKQLDPPRKRGRRKGTTKHLENDAELMLEAYYLYQTGHFFGDQKGANEPVRSTNEALVRTVGREWPEQVRQPIKASLGNGVAPCGDAFFQLGTDRYDGGASQAAERAGG